MRPEFVDNRNGNTLVAALRGHLDWLREAYKQPVELSIATGYFNPEGFALIADKLRKTKDSHEWRFLKPYIGLFRNYWRFHAPIDEIPVNTVVASFNDKRACHLLHTLFVIKAVVLSA